MPREYRLATPRGGMRRLATNPDGNYVPVSHVAEWVNAILKAADMAQYALPPDCTADALRAKMEMIVQAVQSDPDNQKEVPVIQGYPGDPSAGMQTALGRRPKPGSKRVDAATRKKMVQSFR